MCFSHLVNTQKFPWESVSHLSLVRVDSTRCSIISVTPLYYLFSLTDEAPR